MRHVRFIVWIVAAWWSFALSAPGQLGAQEASAPAPAGQRVPTPTLGGKQFWADELFFHQWRIQRSSLTGECRLLDERDFCHTTGSFESCQEVLDEIKRQRHLPPMHGQAVLVLHGLFRTRGSMNSLCNYLQQQGKYLVLNVEYPSTQADVAEHARSLGKIIEHLDGIEQIHLVGHSLGNIIIRRYMADRMALPPEQQTGPRLGRFVMLGPPNHGSELASHMADEPLYQAVTGEVGQQLGPEWPWLEATLATPPCEFGIIAGGLQNDQGFNPLLPGDDDGTVTVQSTRLEGAKDFLLLPVVHSFMMDDKQVMEQTLLFLKKGRFRKPRT